MFVCFFLFRLQMFMVVLKTDIIQFNSQITFFYNTNSQQFA